VPSHAAGIMWGKGLLDGIASSFLFIILNAALNLYTKWLFSADGVNFPFPWTMLTVQQLEAYLVLQAWLIKTDLDNKAGWDVGLRDVSKLNALMQVLAATVLFCLNVGLNSLSLVHISITLNQTVRAFLPVGVLLLSSCMERRVYPLHAYLTTAVIVVGIALTCWGNPNFEMFGFSLALLSTMIAALGSSLNGWLLNSAGPFQSGSGGIARLMMLQSVPAFFMFGIVAMILERQALLDMMSSMSTGQCYEKLAVVLGSGVLALMSNLGRCGLVAATGALMETMAGNAKVALLCVIDHELFGTVLNGHNYLGIGVTFAAFSAHVLMQYAGKAAAEEIEVLEAIEEDEDDDISELRPPGSPMKLSPKKKAKFSLPRLVSGAETGLAAEHVALRRGTRGSLRGGAPNIFRNWSFAAVTEWSEDDDGSPVPRSQASAVSSLLSHRSISWQPGDSSPADVDANLWQEFTRSTATPGSAGSEVKGFGELSLAHSLQQKQADFERPRTT